MKQNKTRQNKTKQNNTIQNNTIQTQHNTKQHNTTQHNTLLRWMVIVSLILNTLFTLRNTKLSLLRSDLTSVQDLFYHYQNLKYPPKITTTL